jgi:hypothetical protein
VRRQRGNAAEEWHEQQYLAPDGFVVSLQNSINAERIANIVGWGKVVGCIASTIGVDAYKAGHVMRTQQPGGSTYTIFRVGEVHGRRPGGCQGRGSRYSGSDPRGTHRGSETLERGEIEAHPRNVETL